VSQNNIDQGQAAEPPSQGTKTFIRQVRPASSWNGSEEKCPLVTSADGRESSQAFSMPGPRDPRDPRKRGKSVSPGTR